MLTRQFGQVDVKRKNIGDYPEFIRAMFRDVDALIVETVNDFCNDCIRYLFHSPLLPVMEDGAQPLLCGFVTHTESITEKVEVSGFEIVWEGK